MGFTCYAPVNAVFTLPSIMCAAMACGNGRLDVTRHLY